jgi:wyosine [tRNA(Phe)-imidazoG37] synthetase (radical SAM superfamily)
MTTPSHIFGPVPSRRLGISLGVDIIPFKTCSLDCVYCECGRTTRLSLDRRSFTPPDQVLSELRQILESGRHLDYITFSGSGEPTLSADLGRLIRAIKRITAVPIAVLTNGTLLYRPEVREELLAADLVLPSLDGATRTAFDRLNQPHPELDLDIVIGGMEAFRKEFPGKIWLEIFIVKSINDTPPELAALHLAAHRLQPDRVQLNTLDRPPAYPGIESADIALLEKIYAEWQDLPVEIIRRYKKREEILAFSLNLENSILNTIRRRPLTIEDLMDLTGRSRVELFKYLDVLEKEKRIKPQITGARIFYTIVPTP